ncbi:MAG: dethiobiotin synthase [Nitrospirota bacterium]
MKGIFITGTDTGVGKTYVGACIAAALRRKGIDVGVMKPAETGCRLRRGEPVPADTLVLMRAAGVADPPDLVNPYRFLAPLAPLVAAEREGKGVNLRTIVAAYRSLEQRHEFMIVEGAGGVLVPLTRGKSFRDLAADLGLPVLIVARPGLGTINHTLLTIEALQRNRIPLAGIVINYVGPRASGLAERTNPAVIERLSGVPVIGIIRHGQSSVNAMVRRLVPAAAGKRKGP